MAVLAAPLRVGGWPVGTLEVYSREKTAWSPVYVALLESLAAQASVSLEAAHLFDRVARSGGGWRRCCGRRRSASPSPTPTAPTSASTPPAPPCSASRRTPTSPPPPAPPAPPAPAGATGPWQLFADADPLPPEQYPLVRAARGEEVRGQEVEVLLPDRQAA